ncbi:hepcidin-1 isoform X2 [Stegastes partitus]|uniref:Hepcidin-1 isoform X2 n=1 Tax=Stegastes partitus TaxID=144197 RepID=A0A9Y4K2L7_9TELE|nr:PREDICTED: hepcidin-like isoform X2 [Stegastes partitus]
MKTFSVAVAVAVMLTFICIQESSAVPLSEVEELEEEMSTDNPDATQEETSVETWMMPFNIRENGYTGPIRCRYCCGCCALGVCGICCK